MRILIIEDEIKLAAAIKLGLEKVGYAVDYVADSQSGLQRLKMSAEDYDVLILDLVMPHLDGFDVCRSLRQLGIYLPILVLTARNFEEDKVAALDAGADDYVVKPFSFQELLARLRALLRRPHQVIGDKLTIRNIELNPQTRIVSHDGGKVYLTNKEFMLLEYLMRHPNQVMTREQIIEHLWGDDFDSFSNIVDVHVKNLRKKLKDKNGSLIQTVQSVGYR